MLGLFYGLVLLYEARGSREIHRLWFFFILQIQQSVYLVEFDLIKDRLFSGENYWFWFFFVFNLVKRHKCSCLL